jgi:hypothetical protein
MWWLEVKGKGREGKGEERRRMETGTKVGEARLGRHSHNKTSSKLPRGKKWTRSPD